MNLGWGREIGLVYLFAIMRWVYWGGGETTAKRDGIYQLISKTQTVQLELLCLTITAMGPCGVRRRAGAQGLNPWLDAVYRLSRRLRKPGMLAELFFFVLVAICTQSRQPIPIPGHVCTWLKPLHSCTPPWKLSESRLAVE